MKKTTFYIMVPVLCLALQATGQQGELEQYQAQYQSGLERVETNFREKRLAMPAAQVQALRKLELEYQRAGDLQGMLAVQQERKRFVLDPRGRSIPNVRTPAELARLLNAYKTRFAAVAEERDRSVASLNQRYLDALRKLQVKLTQQGDIEEAKRVMQTIASQGQVPATPAPQARPQPPPAAAAPPSAPAPSGGTAPQEAGDDFFDSWFE